MLTFAIPANTQPESSLRLTLEKGDKLRLGSEFYYVRNNGRKYIGRLLVLVSADSPDGKLRCGVICGKKFSRKAVERNRARRLLWESFRLLKPRIKVNHMVLITRKLIMGRKRQEVEQELSYLLAKAGRLQD